MHCIKSEQRFRDILSDNSKIMKRLFSVSLQLLILAGCSFGGPLREDVGAKNFRLGKLSSSWQALPEKLGADAAFENPRSGAVIAVESLCQRYEDERLSSLTKQLISPFSHVENLSQESGMLDGRESLKTSFRGRLDGVAVESRTIVFRKNRCFFDFLLHSKDKISADDEADFKRFVEAFHYAGE